MIGDPPGHGVVGANLKYAPPAGFTPAWTPSQLLSLDRYPSSGYHLARMVWRVVLSRGAPRALRQVPDYIADTLLAWVALVEARGLEEARKIPGYHDEPLSGERRGQRSIRLSKATGRSTRSALRQPAPSQSSRR